MCGDSAIELKKTLIRTKNAIKKKFQNLHDNRMALSERVHEEYKPIIEPLNKLVEKQAVVKQEKNDFKLEPLSTTKRFKGDPLRLSFSDFSIPKTATKEKINISKNYANNDDSDDNRYSDENSIDFHDTFESPQTNIASTSTSSTAAKTKIVPSTSADLSTRFYSVQKDDNNDLYLGADKVIFRETDIKIKNKKFTLTPGVVELLLMRNPTKYTNKDLNVFKSMLTYTNAHRVNFEASGNIVRDETNVKYSKIIKTLFPPVKKTKPITTTKNEKKKTSGGKLRKKSLQTDYMVRGKSNRMHYTYWDDPNELVERLRLLVASQGAGHNGHNNEIISIVEELREANIIS